MWECRFPGCDRVGTGKRRVPLSSSVHCSLGHTGRDTHWPGPHRWPHAGKAWTHKGSHYPGTSCLGIQAGSGRNRRCRCQYRGLHSGTGKGRLCLGSAQPSGRGREARCREAPSIPGGTGSGKRAQPGGSGSCVDRASGHISPPVSGNCPLCSQGGRGSGAPEGCLGRSPGSYKDCLHS